MIVQRAAQIFLTVNMHMWKTQHATAFDIVEFSNV